MNTKRSTGKDLKSDGNEVLLEKKYEKPDTF